MDVQPNKVAWITGSSRGIGEALVLNLLNDGFKVIGLSRNNEIEHPHYTFHEIDLTDLKAVKAFEFKNSGAEVNLLVNNAGMIGDIAPIGQMDNEMIERMHIVNTIAPQILCNNFLASFQENKGHFHIINISSGAGKNAIESWAPYCSSKAALDLFSETLAAELKWMEMENWSVHAIAPGVVDTKMQVEIRSSDEAKFPHKSRFVGLKENQELASPELVASKLKLVIDEPSKFQEVVISVRDF